MTFSRTPFFLLIAMIGACGAPAPRADDVAGSANQASPVEPAPADGVRAATIPASFHGVFDRSPESCASRTEYRLTIGPSELRFHESIARVRQVTTHNANSIVVTADHQGEGESWSSERELRFGENSSVLIVRSEGNETVRVRCSAAPAPSSRQWSEAAGDEEAGLVLHDEGVRRLGLYCPAGSDELVVNVPAFRAIASEERMSFGSGGEVVALVADPSGDKARGGVSGRGPLPEEVGRILTGSAGISVNYGAQNSGPYPAPPEPLASAFLDRCRG